MEKKGKQLRIRPRQVGTDFFGSMYFPGYDFGGDFVVKHYWSIDLRTGEGVLYLYKQSKTVHVGGGHYEVSPSVHALVQIGPVLKDTRADRIATVVEWDEPGSSWHKTKKRLKGKGHRHAIEQKAIR